MLSLLIRFASQSQFLWVSSGFIWLSTLFETMWVVEINHLRAITPDKRDIHLIFFLFSLYILMDLLTFCTKVTICCGYSLEVPWQCTSNEYHNICYSGEIRKMLVLFGWKKCLEISVLFGWKKAPYLEYVSPICLFMCLFLLFVHCFLYIYIKYNANTSLELLCFALAMNFWPAIGTASPPSYTVWFCLINEVDFLSLFFFKLSLLDTFKWKYVPDDRFSGSVPLTSKRFQPSHIATDKRGFPHNIFLISPRKHMLWVLIRSASVRRF